MKQYFCALIGGGAASLLAANFLSDAGKSAVILEKQDRVGRKLLSTGNGRCNFANTNATGADYDNPFAGAALSNFTPDKVIGYFEELGIPARIDSAGRCYPASGQAASVLDALRLGAQEKGADILTDFRATGVKKEKDGFSVRAEDGRTVEAKYVLVATGGVAAPKLGSSGDGYEILKKLGHRKTRLYPALAPLNVDAKRVRGLKGVRAECEIALLANGREVRREAGEVLFGDGTVSGIAAMQLARDAEMALDRGEKPEIVLCFGRDGAEYVARRALASPHRPAREILNGAVHKALSQVLAAEAGIASGIEASEMTEKNIRKFGERYSAWRMEVTGTQGFQAAQVTGGGIDTKDFVPATMESLLVPGVYAAGEVLDVDGGCGGYNLMWAWASAMAAARGMMEK